METGKNNKKETAENEIQQFEVNSLFSFLAKIMEIIGNEEPKLYAFRGHKMLSYKLLPGIGRPPHRYSKEQEMAMFYQFKRNYKRFYPIELHNDIDIMMLGQHYGLKTRLLDWSFNPLVALYMATDSVSNTELKEAKNNNACEANVDDGIVYIKKMPSFKYLREGDKKNPFEFTKNEFLIPENFEIRFINQEGFFEIFADPCIESADKITHKIIIHRKDKEKIRNQLEKIGINELFVYPTLENLCRDTVSLFVNSEINKTEKNK